MIYAGEHTKGKDQKFTVDEDLIDHWAATGNEMLSDDIKIPLPTKHDETDPTLNRGYVESFSTGVDSKGRKSLYMAGKFADEESAKLVNRSDVSLYSPVSRAIGGKTYSRPITSVALTNQPVIRGLEGFTLLSLSYDSLSLSESDIAAVDQAGYEMAGEHGRSYLNRSESGELSLSESKTADSYLVYIPKSNK